VIADIIDSISDYTKILPILSVWIVVDLKAGCSAFQCRLVINKCFLLNTEKKLALIRPVVFEKNAKTHTLITKNDVTEPKVRLLG